MVKITINSQLDNKLIIDIIKYEKEYVIHKQVEKRNGHIFVRLKKRSLLDNT